MSPAGCDVGLGRLLDYLCDAPGDAADEAFEEHLFACATCAESVDGLERLRGAVAAAAAGSLVAANVDTTFLERARRDGKSLREYRLPAGASVPCSAGPEDWVVVRLVAAAVGDPLVEIRGELHDLERDAIVALPPRQAAIDRASGEVLLVFPGELVRGYPRSRWTLRLRTETGEIGPFVMDHSPEPSAGPL